MNFSLSIFSSKSLSRTGLGLLSLAAIGLVWSTMTERSQAAAAPNIVLIVSDDQGYADLGAAGLADDVSTPNIDRLAEMGVRFDNAYATSPICNASRMGLMIGSYQERLGTWWYGGKGLQDERFTTIAELAKKAGYNNGYIGKFHYGEVDQHEPTDRNFPLNHGFDEFYGFGSPRKHFLIHEEQAENNFLAARKKYAEDKGQSLRQGGFWVGREKRDQQGFSTTLIGDAAVDFINRQSDKPFFMQVSFNAVHNFTYQLPQEYLKQHNLTGYPGDWDPSKGPYYEWYASGRFPNNPEGRALYLGQLHFMDREIGRIVDSLKSSNLLDNTLIVFLSDNGGSTPIYANNAPLRGSKYTLYEGGIRVPLIIAGPDRFQKNTVRANLVSSMDILPTLARAMGVNAPDHIDGLDLTELLSGGNPQLEHSDLAWGTASERAYREGKWKYHLVENEGDAPYEMVEIELGEFLYDLEADPGEKVNLAENYPEVLARLRNKYAQWKLAMDAGEQGHSG